MLRREFLKASGFSLALVAAGRNHALAGLIGQNTNFKALRNNVGIFTGNGGTIGWLINNEGSVVVDSQFPESAAVLIAEMKRRTGKPLKYLLNTHHHADHTAGNIAFEGIAEHVVSHLHSAENQRAMAAKQNTVEKQLFPDKTFKDDMDFHVGDEQLKLYYFGAGHTNGDAVIHFKNANIVHMGDLVFNRKFPFIDRSAGANIHSWIKALGEVTEKFDNDTQYIFGHALDPEAVTGTRADVKAFQHYLEMLMKHVGNHIKSGRSKEELLKTTSIPGAPQWKGEGIERSLTAAYDEISEAG